jgi:hypothetical protein
MESRRRTLPDGGDVQEETERCSAAARDAVRRFLAGEITELEMQRVIWFWLARLPSPIWFLNDEEVR